MHVRDSRAYSAMFCIVLLASLSVLGCGRPKQSDSPTQPVAAPEGVTLTESARTLGGKLALSAGGRIWSVSDGKWERVTDGPSDVQPAWEKDGENVLFVRQNADFSDLYTVAPGGQPRKLLSNKGKGKPGSRGYALTSSWALSPSPGEDGSVVLLTDRGGSARVVELRPERGEKLRTVAGRDVLVADPQVSPEGTQVAYLEYSEGRGELAVMPLNGKGRPDTLTNLKQGVYDPAWAADGHSLYFVASAGGSGELYTVAPGAKPQKLYSGEAVRQPVAAGADGRIAYLKREGDAWQVWTAIVSEADGKLALKDEQRVTEGEGLAPDSNLDWRPYRG